MNATRSFCLLLVLHLVCLTQSRASYSDATILSNALDEWSRQVALNVRHKVTEDSSLNRRNRRCFRCAIQVSMDGIIKGTTIEESCGSKSSDRAFLKLIQNDSPLPKPPGNPANGVRTLHLELSNEDGRLKVVAKSAATVGELGAAEVGAKR